MSTSKKISVQKSLLNDEAAVQAVLSEGELDESRARMHVKNVVHRLFVHERNVVHKKLLQDYKDGLLPLNNPVEATKVECEFTVETVSTNLPRSMYKTLAGWSVLTSKVVLISESVDYVTTKLLIETEGGHNIESVILRHSKRTTLCVSSQVGCKMGCAFCATGTLGQRANLTSNEIQ
jgi:hypothetical protein